MATVKVFCKCGKEIYHHLKKYKKENLTFSTLEKESCSDCILESTKKIQADITDDQLCLICNFHKSEHIPCSDKLQPTYLVCPDYHNIFLGVDQGYTRNK